MASKPLNVARLTSQTIRYSTAQSSWRPLPFLCPNVCRRNINTVTMEVKEDPNDVVALMDSDITSPLRSARRSKSSNSSYMSDSSKAQSTSDLNDGAFSPRYTPSRAPSAPDTLSRRFPAAHSTIPIPSSSSSSQPTSTPRSPINLTSLRDTLPHLTAQGPYYITIHIHGRPYLVTAGDTLRLPFLMHGVTPGDILRLDRASLLGSRDWTLKPSTASYMPESDSDSDAQVSPSVPADMEALQSSSETSEPIVGNTDGLVDTATGTGAGVATRSDKGIPAPRPRQRFLDDRLFVCRAVVMGTESEPMRIKEKTKKRQRRIKKVKSKHRFTILKVSEVRVKELAELESMAA